MDKQVYLTELQFCRKQENFNKLKHQHLTSKHRVIPEEIVVDQKELRVLQDQLEIPGAACSQIPNMKQKLEDFSSELKVQKLEVHNQTMQKKE